MEGFWGFMVVGMPIILIVVLAVAMRRNKSSKASLARTEQATRDLYQAQNAEDHANDKP